LSSGAALDAQAPTPYKLGMFRQGSAIFWALVLNDATVIDLSRANVGAPATLKALNRWMERRHGREDRRPRRGRRSAGAGGRVQGERAEDAAAHAAIRRAGSTPR